MVAFRNLAVLSLTALPSVIATIDFKDNYVKPYEVKPLTYSNGWQWENTDLIGGLLDVTGNLLVDLLAGINVDIDLGIDLFGKKKHPKYGHPIGIVGGYDGHYKKPTTVYHSSGKPFNILNLSAFCCVGDLHKKCDLLDCHIKLSGFDKVKGGKKIYDHDFYIPKPYKGSDAPIDIDVTTDGVISLGAVGIDLSSLVIDIDLFDLVDVDVNTDKKKNNRGRYSYKPVYKSHRGHGLLVDLDLDIKL